MNVMGERGGGERKGTEGEGGVIWSNSEHIECL